MEIFTRKCVRDFEGLLEFDALYLTSDILADGTIIIFSSPFWIKAPITYFDAGELIAKQ